MRLDGIMLDMQGDFIDNQHVLSRERGTLGPFGNLHDNGCGVVAVYNIMKCLGGEASLSALIQETNRSWIRALGLGGWLGVLPWWIKRILHRRGFSMRPCFHGKNTKKISDFPGEHQVYLILYLWKGKGRIGAHYQAAWQREDGTVVTWNENRVDDGFAGYMERKKTQENLVWMWIWRIDP